VDEKELKVIEKVKKLLALAGSSNEHEAVLATTKAQGALDKANLTMLDVTSSKSMGKIGTQDMCLGVRYHQGWEVMLFVRLSRAYDCEPFSCSKRKGKEFRAGWKVAGYEQDIEVLEYVHDYIHNTIKTITAVATLDADVEGQREKANFRASFMEGMVVRICQDIERQRVERLVKDTKCQALVAQRGANVKTWLYDNHKMGESTNSYKAGTNGEAFEQGFTAGAKVSLRKGIEGKETKIQSN